MTTINNPIPPSGILTLKEISVLEQEYEDMNRLGEHAYLASDLREAEESGDPKRIEQIKSLITDQLTMEN